MKNLMLKTYCAVAATLLTAQSAAAQQDAGDVLNRLNEFGDETQNLMVTIAQLAGLGFLIAGIIMLVKKQEGPQQQNGRMWGFVMLFGGGALFAILTMRNIMSESVTG